MLIDKIHIYIHKQDKVKTTENRLNHILSRRKIRINRLKTHGKNQIKFISQDKH